MLKKASQIFFAIGMFILLLSIASFAQAKKKPMGKKMAEHAKCADSKKCDSTKCESEGTASAEIKIWNKLCPVMGEEVDSQVKTVEYKGKTIGFCCKGCAAKFEKDPEKYMKKLSEDGTKYLGS